MIPRKYRQKLLRARDRADRDELLPDEPEPELCTCCECSDCLDDMTPLRALSFDTLRHLIDELCEEIELGYASYVYSPAWDPYSEYSTEEALIALQEEFDRRVLMCQIGKARVE